MAKLEPYVEEEHKEKIRRTDKTINRNHGSTLFFVFVDYLFLFIFIGFLSFILFKIVMSD